MSTKQGAHNVNKQYGYCVPYGSLFVDQKEIIEKCLGFVKEMGEWVRKLVKMGETMMNLVMGEVNTGGILIK